MEGYHQSDQLLFGRIIYNDGSMYEGAVKDGMKEGRGTYTYPLGARFDGFWKKDKKSGYGVYATEKGERFKGMWADNR